jgi:hypothetical protein
LSTVRRIRCLAALVAFAAAGTPAPAHGDCDGDECSFAAWGWRAVVTAPKNWQPSEERSYPSVRVWMMRRDPPGRMLVSAERLDQKLDALAYANRTARLLETLGFTVGQPQLHSQTGAFWVDFDNGAVFLREAFLVVGGVGYALTLAARDRKTRGQHLRAFDQTLRTMKIKRPPTAKPDAEDAAGADQPTPATAAADTTDTADTDGAPAPARETDPR